MTVSTAYAPLTYAGNSSTTTFPVTWPFFTGSLVVTLITSLGVETVQTITTHYTVSGGTDSNGLPSTGAVTMLSAPATGITLRVDRVTPRTQTATWATNDPFPEKVVEAGFDKQVLLAQEALYTAEHPDVVDVSASIGTVTTGAAGTSASASISEPTEGNLIFNFTIPRGDTGQSGVGSGDMVAAQNLNDLASKKTGFDNISVHGADVASASTIDLDAATGNLVDVTGTTTITAITLANGRERTVRFTGILTLTNGASLVLPGGANIATEAGDVAIFRGYAAGVVRCVNYQRLSHATFFADIKQASTTAATGVVELATTAEAATGTDTSRAVVPTGLFPAEADVASATTTDLGAATTTAVRITGTTTITSFGTANAGIRRSGRFAGVLTLTHNATTLILPSGASITTAAGDTFEALSLGSGNWLVSDYTRASGQSLAGGISAATQAELEAASVTNTYSSPGRQHFHPSAAKAWVRFNSAGTVAASYNITSVTDTGVGDWTVNIGTDFSSASYCGVAFGGAGSAGAPITYNISAAAAAGTFKIIANDTGGTPIDPTINEIYAAFFGDHA